MKTNNIMVRNDAFIQRTKDGYFSATKLLAAWNYDNPGNRKEISKYKLNKAFKDFAEQLQSEGIEKPLLASNKGTWMHPKLFIDFAMWVSVQFKSVVIDYVLDGLITSRHDAGDYYKEMCATILETHVDYYGCKPNPLIYITEAKRINELLDVDKKSRNEMTEKELNSITHLQKVNSLLLRKKTGKAARIKQLMFQSEALKI